MSKYASQLFPQSIYRKAKKDVLNFQDMDTKLLDLSTYTEKTKADILEKIISLNTLIISIILPPEISFDDTKYLKKIKTDLGLNTKKSGRKTASIADIWTQIEPKILNIIKSYILERYASEILTYFSLKIQYLVKQYARYLPKHVANSEIDDLSTIAQLEFIETLKSWNPNKREDVWPLAYTRINGAMKDHIRYVTKSDPSRFYDWVTDAAQLYISQHNNSDFELKIETGVQLNDAIKVLTDREKHIVLSYTQKDETFQQISKRLKLSESQVSRIYKKAIQKIKKEVDRPARR